MTQVMSSALLRLYPRAWQRRYGDEMRELLAAQKLSVRTLADLIAGAIDARLNPHLMPASDTGTNEGVKHMANVFSCARGEFSTADQVRSAAWMIGVSLALTLLSFALRMRLGPNALSESLVLSAFPAALMMSMESTYLKRYSRAARITMSAGCALLVVLIMWWSVALNDRI